MRLEMAAFRVWQETGVGIPRIHQFSVVLSESEGRLLYSIFTSET